MKEYRKKWLSLGYLCDPVLIKAVRAYHKKISTTAGVPVPLSIVVRMLLRRGLEHV